MSKSNNVVPFVVRAEDGSVDLDASTEKFCESLSAYKSSQETGNEEILAAWTQIREELGSANYNFNYIRSRVIAVMGFAPGDAYKEGSERVEAVLRAQYHPLRKGRSKLTLRSEPLPE